MVNGIHEVEAVPPHDVPAWTEVTHHWLDNWTINLQPGTPPAGSEYLHSINILGRDYSSVSQTGLGADPNDVNTTTLDPPNVSLPYVVPNDWGHEGVNGAGPSGGTPFLHSNNNPGGSIYSASTHSNATNIGTHVGGTSYTGAVEVFDNNYLNIETPAGKHIFLSQLMSTPWVVGSWYLVDIELDYGTWGGVSHPNSGEDGGNGYIMVHGVASVNDYDPLQSIGGEGIGEYRGGAGGESIMMLPVTRTEYGTTRKVLRALFKFPSDCLRNQSAAHRDHFTLWIRDIPTQMRIEKVITKKLDYITSTGNATNWIHDYAGTPTNQAHSFSKRELYWRNNMLCWWIKASANYQTNYRWCQDFNTGGTQAAPEVTPLGWRYNFTVSNNPDTGNMYNEVRGFITRDASGDTTPPANGMEGLYFTDIQDVGKYEIRFNMDGDDTSWTIEHSTDNGITWTDYSGTATLNNVSSMTAWTSNTYGEKIGFMPGQDSTARFAISDILLTDETIIFQGGSSGSWNFDGFVTSEDNWIYWDMTNQRLTFENAPIDNPDEDGIYYINANQWIDKPIKEHEQYRVEFTALINSGTFRIYYFNNDGKGFVWEPPISSNYGVETSYTQLGTASDPLLTIGSHNEDDHPYMNLRETFVIQLNDPTELTNGWVDNVSMTRVFSPSGYEEKTLTFSEDVNGWTSFKSFVPESGVSLSKKYFTMKDGGLFQHYVPMVDGVMSYTVEEANNYNMFYDQPDPFASIMKIVLNNDPSTIKTFNTLNYEGSQAHIKKPLSATPTNIVDPLNPDGGITIHNVEAWKGGSDIDGWNCTEIKTDIDTGSIVEFIKKEGKWFNYIKGKAVNLNDAPDTSRFSVQGIGIPSSVMAITSGTSGGGNGGASNGGAGNGGAGNGGANGGGGGY